MDRIGNAEFTHTKPRKCKDMQSANPTRTNDRKLVLQKFFLFSLAQQPNVSGKLVGH